MHSYEVSIVIPAYNESKRLPRTLDKLAEEIQSGILNPVIVKEVLVVDDGSKDNTIEVAEKYKALIQGLQVIKSDKNYGKGHAVRTGLIKAKSNWLLVADADMSTPWPEVIKLAKACEDNHAEVAIGSRDLGDSEILIHQSWIREHLGKLFNVLVRMITALPYKDTQCGFKLAERKAIAPFLGTLAVNRFAWDVEFLMRSKARGLKIVETPVRWAHQDESRVRPIRDGLNMAYTVTRLRIMSLFRD